MPRVGFDWQTNYVIMMNAHGRTADVSARVTLASSDSTSFANAGTAVIAGRVNRQDTGSSIEPSGGEDNTLGLPLPGGPVAVFQPHGDAMLLAGEDVEIELAQSTQVPAESAQLTAVERSRTIKLVARNARRFLYASRRGLPRKGRFGSSGRRASYSARTGATSGV